MSKAPKDDSLDQIDWSHPFGTKKQSASGASITEAAINEAWARALGTGLLPYNRTKNPPPGYPEELMKKCTCGSSSVGSPFHSDWCDLYEAPVK